MAGDFFDSFLDSDVKYNRPARTIWSYDLDDKGMEDDIHKWLVGEIQHLYDKNRERTRLIKRNQMLYRGVQYDTQDTRSDLRDRTVDRSRNVKKIVVNHLYDLTQQRVAKLVKFKPSVSINPTNDEFEDKVSARLTKKLLDHIWYNEKFQGRVTAEVATVASVMGEAYCFVKWDPNKGDIHPDSPKNGEKVKVKTDSGEEFTVDREIKTGDVCYEVVLPHEVFLQDRTRLEDCEYCFRVKNIPVEEANLLYPGVSDKIKNTRRSTGDGLLSQDDDGELDNMVTIYEFWHKGTPGLPKGRHIVFTLDGVILNTEHPFSHLDFPFVRFTDIDIPGDQYGISFFETIKMLTSTYNNLTNVVLRNEILASHPKWMVPSGSVKLESLGNDITIVQYKGAQPPMLVQSQPTPPEVFNFLDRIKQEFQQISGITGVSRGEPPPGIKAGVALQFLNEMENNRFNVTALKWNEFIREVAIKTLGVAGDYYESSDNRMIRVLGKEDQWQTVFFDQAHLSKSYDVRIANASAISESKAQKVQTIIDLNEQFPGAVDPRQVLELLELGQAEKFYNIATMSIRAAEAENEIITNNEGKVEVQEYEDHISHWKTHVQAIQKISFKRTVPMKQQQELKDHIMVHEMMMEQVAKKNPAFMEQLQTLPLYPLFYTPDLLAEQPEPEEELLPEMGGGMGGLAPEGELPINPALAGAEAQLPVQEAARPLMEQPQAAEAAIPPSVGEQLNPQQ